MHIICHIVIFVLFLVFILLLGTLFVSVTEGVVIESHSINNQTDRNIGINTIGTIAVTSGIL